MSRSKFGSNVGTNSVDTNYAYVAVTFPQERLLWTIPFSVSMPVVKILLVITHGFLNSQWRTYEMEQGVLRSVFKPNTLMVIMLNEIPRTELPLKLQRFVDKTSYLVWDDSKSDKMCEKIKTKLGSPLTVKNQGTSGNSKESTWQQCNSYV